MAQDKVKVGENREERGLNAETQKEITISIHLPGVGFNVPGIFYPSDSCA